MVYHVHKVLDGLEELSMVERAQMTVKRSTNNCPQPQIILKNGVEKLQEKQIFLLDPDVLKESIWFMIFQQMSCLHIMESQLGVFMIRTNFFIEFQYNGNQLDYSVRKCAIRDLSN